MSARERILGWRDEVGDAYVLGVVRAAMGGLLFWQALDAARDFTAHGYFGDVFHVPFVPEAWVPSRDAYIVLTAARLLLGVLVAVGHRARYALFGSALLGVYVMLCDRLQFHHNRYALCCLAFLLSFAPCDRSVAITRAASTVASRKGPLWAARLAQLQVSITYLASGGSKLLDADWREGVVIGDRFLRYGGQAVARGVPAGVVEAFSHPLVTSGLAKLAIGTELFLAIGLFSRRTRILALWWGLMFHLTIEVTSKVELFTWLTLTAYALFVTPDVRARKIFFDPTRPRGVIYARSIALLDWFLRFDIRAWEPDALKKGHTLVLVRRDGSRVTGVRALAMVARCVPLLFPLWAPLAFLASFTKGGDVAPRA